MFTKSPLRRMCFAHYLISYAEMAENLRKHRLFVQLFFVQLSFIRHAHLEVCINWNKLGLEVAENLKVHLQ